MSCALSDGGCYFGDVPCCGCFLEGGDTSINVHIERLRCSRGMETLPDFSINKVICTYCLSWELSLC